MYDHIDLSPYRDLFTRLHLCNECHEAHEVMHNHRWERHNSGCYKVAFVKDDAPIVIKVCRNGIHGAQESTNRKLVPEFAREWFLPILTEGRFFQVQESLVHVKTADCPGFGECPACVLLCDVEKGHNHTHLTNGMPVVYDYGQGVLQRQTRYILENSTPRVLRKLRPILPPDEYRTALRNARRIAA